MPCGIGKPHKSQIGPAKAKLPRHWCRDMARRKRAVSSSHISGRASASPSSLSHEANQRAAMPRKAPKTGEVVGFSGQTEGQARSVAVSGQWLSKMTNPTSGQKSPSERESRCLNADQFSTQGLYITMNRRLSHRAQHCIPQLKALSMSNCRSDSSSMSGM